MATLLTDRYKSDPLGVLSCYDRIVITGTLPEICFAQGMTNYLKARQIKIFDYPKAFADPLRHTIRENAQAVADSQGVAIEFIKTAHLRKEDLVAKVLNARGNHPGLVHILSAMEPCSAYEPWHDKQTQLIRAQSPANACTTTFILWMPNWDCAISEYRRGAPSVCNFTATAISSAKSNCWKCLKDFRNIYIKTGNNIEFGWIGGGCDHNLAT